MNNTIIKYNTILKYMAIILSVVVVFNSSSFRLGITSVYYASVISILILIGLMINQKYQIMSFPMLFLYIAGFASLFFNDIPHYYNSERRFLMFICITVLVGPFIGSKQFNFFRIKLFYYLNILLIAFSSLSFLGLSTGIYRGITESRFEGIERKDFTGLFNHSMLLGPMAGLAVLACLYFLYSVKPKWKKYLLLVCISLCALSCITAGSRSALMGTIAGILFFFYKLYRENMGRYVKTIFLIFMVGIMSFPLWENRTDFLMKKVAASEAADDWAYSRASRWERRIMEFKQSPIIGIGFASEDLSLSDIDENVVEEMGGNVEPGSSWLAILSMTGILGLIPVLIIFGSNYIFVLGKTRNRLWLAYLGGMLSFFVLHMFAEGYVFAFGSLLFFCLWILLGAIQITKEKYNTDRKNH